MRRIAGLGKSGGTLDYVTAWFLKAGAYLRAGLDSGAGAGGAASLPQPGAGAAVRSTDGGRQPAGRTQRIGFVATNSITQGEQVAQLWPLIFDRLGLEIAFARRTFSWQSDIRGMAHVHVVIVGLTPAAAAPADRRLFSYPDLKGDAEESVHAAISPYLFGADSLADSHLVVRETARQLNGWPALLSGSQPIDNGRYIFNADQRAELLDAEPLAEKFLRPYVGSREHLQSRPRWILALQDAEPNELAAIRPSYGASRRSGSSGAGARGRARSRSPIIRAATTSRFSRPSPSSSFPKSVPNAGTTCRSAGSNRPRGP